MPTYRLSQAAQLIGVSPITLKRWFLKGDVDEVTRDHRGWRVFTDEDVASLHSFARQRTITRLSGVIENHRQTTIGVRQLENRDKNRLQDADRPAHDWYRFVLSYPPQVIRGYLDRFKIQPGSTVLDPFCGTGTTLVECKKHGIASMGFEAHPMCALASGVKVDWSVTPCTLRTLAETVAKSARNRLASDKTLRCLDDEAEKLLIRDSICPLPLHKALLLKEELDLHHRRKGYRHARLALARTLVSDISNLHFGPEVGVKGRRGDAEVIGAWHSRVCQMASDLGGVRNRQQISSLVFNHDSREMPQIADASVDAVITSPPYPNEKDYTRTTRLESTVLGLITDRKSLRLLKEGLLRSNSRNVYKGDTDDSFIEGIPDILRIADKIESRRVEMGKTSGFEKQYHRVVRLYFGGMARHFAELRRVLKPGARLAYVVGDQASFLRVMIRTGQLLAQVTESLGYEVENIDLFRTRISTVTGEQLREEVLVLRWPGW